MSFKLIAFRCPVDLLERIDDLASAANSSRAVVLAESVRVFAEEVRARGGFIVPPFSAEELEGIAAEMEREDQDTDALELAED